MNVRLCADCGAEMKCSPHERKKICPGCVTRHRDAAAKRVMGDAAYNALVNAEADERLYRFMHRPTIFPCEQDAIRDDGKLDILAAVRLLSETAINGWRPTWRCINATAIA